MAGLSRIDAIGADLGSGDGVDKMAERCAAGGVVAAVGAGQQADQRGGYECGGRRR